MPEPALQRLEELAFGIRGPDQICAHAEVREGHQHCLDSQGHGENTELFGGEDPRHDYSDGEAPQPENQTIDGAPCQPASQLPPQISPAHCRAPLARRRPDVSRL